MNIYRDTKTGRLVKIHVPAVRPVMGCAYEIEDMLTGEFRKIDSFEHLVLVSED